MGEGEYGTRMRVGFSKPALKIVQLITFQILFVFGQNGSK